MYKRLYEEVAGETSDRIRQNEVSALDHSIRLMSKAEKLGPGSRGSIEAMFFVSRLWGVFLEDLASAENALPGELRAKIISIGIWALKYLEAMRQGRKKDFQPLIEISGIILEGIADKAMKIHLKRNEKLFINGAVIMLDRRGSIELLNDAQFLLQSHIMQQEDAKRPLEQIYFITQMMLMDPSNASLIMELFRSYVKRLTIISPSDAYTACLSEVERMVEALDYFGALKLLRKSFDLDDATTAKTVMPEDLKTGVAA